MPPAMSVESLATLASIAATASGAACLARRAAWPTAASISPTLGAAGREGR